MENIQEKIEYVKEKMNQDHDKLQQQLNEKLKEIDNYLNKFKQGKISEMEFRKKYEELKKEGDELMNEAFATHDKRFKKYTEESFSKDVA